MSYHDKLITPQKKNNSRSKQAPIHRSSNPVNIIQRIRMYPQSMTHADTMALQRTIGNQAVCQLMREIGLMKGQTVQKKESKTGLPDNLKAGVENLSGLSMDDVRIHYNSDKPAQVGALAYTQGADIHVAPGQERHLPHEAWHVVQQAQGRVQPTMQLKGIAVNDDEGLEKEADEMKNMITQSSTNHIHNNLHTHYTRTELLQRVLIPDTHKQMDANQYVKEREYKRNPLQSSGDKRRLGLCGACNKVEFMERLQVDHQVPVAFLKKLLELRREDKDLATDIASCLQLDWKSHREIDVSKTPAASYQGWRDRFDDYKEGKPDEFKGRVIEAVTDVGNLWLLCPECNGRREKTDKLLKVDYDALDEFYDDLDYSKPIERAKGELMTKYLDKWIRENYFWDPSVQVPQLDVPNSPTNTHPDEMEL